MKEEVREVIEAQKKKEQERLKIEEERRECIKYGVCYQCASTNVKKTVMYAHPEVDVEFHCKECGWNDNISD